MSVVGFIRNCLDRGMTMELALVAAEAFEAAGTPVETPRQARNRRYYEAQKRLKASENVLKQDATETSEKRLKASETSEIKTPLARVVTNLSKIVIEDTQEDKSSFVSDAKPIKPLKADPKGSRLPANWTPTDEDRRFAAREGLNPTEIDRAADEFRDYWIAATGRTATKLDWSATWRNRVRELANRLGRSRMASAPRQSGRQRQVAASFADVRARRRAEAAVSDDVSADWRVL